MAFKISFQLYSARNFGPLEPQLAILSQLGYDAVEPFLPNYEKSATQFRRQIDAAGLACPSFHMPLDGLIGEPERYIDIALTIGATLMIPPWLPPEQRGQKADDWRRLGGELGKGAEKAKKHGLQVCWHNHDFEFVPLADGTRAIDHIFAAAGPDVGFEIDCGWIERAGASPAAELQNFADRILIIQPKDLAPIGTLAEGGWAAFGDGIIDWQALWPLFRKTPASCLVVEHDDPADWQLCARRSIEAIKKLDR